MDTSNVPLVGSSLRNARLNRSISLLLAAASCSAASFSPVAAQVSLTADAGDIVAANLSGNTVSLHDGATGAYLGNLVTPGSGGLSNPTGVTFGLDGFLYVSSSATHQVLRYDGTTGAFLDVFVSDSLLRTPFSLAFGPSGDLFVSSGSQHEVRRYDGASGEFLGVAASGGGLRQPIGLAFDAEGLLYVANSGGGNVLRFDPGTGESLGVVASDSLRYPSDVAFGPDGDLFVSSAASSAIVRFDGTSGRVRAVLKLPSGAVPVGVAFGADGRLRVADFGRNRLFGFEPGSTDVTLLSDSGLAGPENIAIKKETVEEDL